MASTFGAGSVLLGHLRGPTLPLASRCHGELHAQLGQEAACEPLLDPPTPVRGREIRSGCRGLDQGQ